LGRGLAVVVGLGASGRAAVAECRRRGLEVVAVDDRPTEAVRRAAADLGVELVGHPAPSALASLARAAELVVASPGVPASHPVFGTGARVVSEMELAVDRLAAPVLAVTGTNGKTTVATLARDMLAASGLVAVAAGNIGLPLLEAVSRPADVLVVEVSSFQLALTERLAPRVGAWINLSPDHLDWHPSLEHYVAAKAKIWARQAADDVAVANAEDPVVMERARRVRGRLVTFGLSRGDYRVASGALVGPGGERAARLEELPRSFPHDLANALAAWAAAAACGATLEGCRQAVVAFRGLPHRLELVGEAGGVRYFDDSKATTPASVVAALQGFESVVLIAGGRNKGLSLEPLAQELGRLRAVVAIGEAADELEAALGGRVELRRAGSMPEAVCLAASAARPGDAVLLSPGCASFDWYGSYAERGRDFARWVRELIDRREPRT
jgi:UDP-N-acetylmuramoylalanine--D-glutamate ligase